MEEENVEDLQLAWENLEIARKIVDNRVNEVMLDPGVTRDEKTALQKKLARIHLRMGDVECIRDDFPESKKE